MSEPINLKEQLRAEAWSRIGVETSRESRVEFDTYFDELWGALSKERDINADFYAELRGDFEDALGPHPRIDNGCYIQRIKEIREQLTAARLEAAQARETSDAAQSLLRDAVIDRDALRDELDQRTEELAAARRECQRLMVENGHQAEQLRDIARILTGE